MEEASRCGRLFQWEGMPMGTVGEFLGNAGLMAAVITLVEFLIKRHDAKKGKMAEIEIKLDNIDKRLEKTEKDELRTQLLLLISDYPDNKEGIMTLGQHYFGDLRGNWYATSIFNQWLEQTGTAKPEWFKEE